MVTNKLYDWWIEPLSRTCMKWDSKNSRGIYRLIYSRTLLRQGTALKQDFRNGLRETVCHLWNRLRNLKSPLNSDVSCWILFQFGKTFKLAFFPEDNGKDSKGLVFSLVQRGISLFFSWWFAIDERTSIELIRKVSRALVRIIWNRF